MRVPRHLHDLADAHENLVDLHTALAQMIGTLMLQAQEARDGSGADPDKLAGVADALVRHASLVESSALLVERHLTEAAKVVPFPGGTQKARNNPARPVER